MPFGAESTTDEVLDGIDLSGRTAVVTGASAGLGVETTRALAAHGARVVMAVRDLAKGHQALQAVRAAVPDAEVELAELDLGSLASARTCALDLLARHPRIDLLINNAGVMACPQGYTSDGFEMQLGTNHLGQFAFTCRLVPALLAAAPARIVNLSSRGHQRSRIDWDDPHFRQRPYDKFIAYGQSKTANIWFTLELDQRLSGRGVRSYAVHPGVIQTELGRHLQPEDLGAMRSRAPQGTFTFKSIPQGAATSVWAATSPELDHVGGVYCEDCHVSTGVASPETRGEGHAPWAYDEEQAARLWEWSEDQVGERFPLS